jgi:hypothetical protein
MTINDNTIQLCIDSVAADVSDMIAQREKISVTDAIREFFATKTYALLIRPASGLYLESNEYVYDMYDAEKTGDIERWLEI